MRQCKYLILGRAKKAESLICSYFLLNTRQLTINTLSDVDYIRHMVRVQGAKNTEKRILFLGAKNGGWGRICMRSPIYKHKPPFRLAAYSANNKKCSKWQYCRNEQRFPVVDI